MQNALNKLLLPGVAILVIAYFSIFKVEQWEQAIMFRFGEIQRTDLGPGLHFMIPLVNTVQKLEMRLLNLDEEPQRFLTFEKKDLIVDYFVKWRITDAKQFYTATRGDIEWAKTLLAQQINSTLRDEFGKRTVQEVVAGERGMVMDIVRGKAEQIAEQLGVAVEDVRTMRIDLPEEVSSAVYDRMRAERERVARDFRARGAEAAERIRANADREREIILAQAYRDAEIIRGEGDAQAAQIYASAYIKNEEFYDFYRSLSSYRKSFGDGNSLLLLEPGSDFFKYLTSPDGKGN